MVKEGTPKKEKKTIEKRWYLIDAKDKVLGRLATRIAIVLMGKKKVSWVPYLDVGDNVVVINSGKVVVTGRKGENKKYFTYSGYPGGLKEKSLKHLSEENPSKVIYHAVAGMLPKTKLGKSMIKKLHVYAGEKHFHESQKPEELEV
jgi:large subunit ribosomal protein L13